MNNKIKKNTLKQTIATYAEKNAYFSIHSLNNFLISRKIKFKNESLKKLLYLLKKEEKIFTAGRGWYSNIDREFVLDTKCVRKLTNLVKNKFPLLEFSVWSTEQLKIFFHHLPGSFLGFIYSERDFFSNIAEFLTDEGYHVYLNPLGKEIDKYVEIKKDSIILRPVVSRGPAEECFARIEKILVDLYVEQKKLNFIDPEEYKKIISSIMDSYRINLSVMLDYAERKKIDKDLRKVVIPLIPQF